MSELCLDRDCRWFDENLEHYVSEHEEMEETAREEEGIRE